MKKIFSLTLCLVLASCVFAQKSESELNKMSKVEAFINSCSYLKESTLNKYSDNGVEIFAKIFTDLKTGEKMGAIKVTTESKVAAAALLAAFTQKGSANDGKPMPLGYIDMSELDDLLKALQMLLDESAKKPQYPYTISYTTDGGLDFYYDQDDNSFSFRKKWYSMNAFGTIEQSTISSESISIKKLKKVIEVLQGDRQVLLNSLK